MAVVPRPLTTARPAGALRAPQPLATAATAGVAPFRLSEQRAEEIAVLVLAVLVGYHGRSGLAFGRRHVKSDARRGDLYYTLDVKPETLQPGGAQLLATPQVEDSLRRALQAPAWCVEVRVRQLQTVRVLVALQGPPQMAELPKCAELPERIPPHLRYPWPVGVSAGRRNIWVELTSPAVGHILVGGLPGAGKSSFIDAGLFVLLGRCGPADLRLMAIDGKAVGLAKYEGIPHLIGSVVSDPHGAAQAMETLVAEIQRRKTLYLALGAGIDNLAEYNARPGVERLPVILCVIDEVVDLVLQWGSLDRKDGPFSKLIRIASTGRAFGVILLMATQNPKAQVLNTLVRDNCGLRVSTRVQTRTQSKIILGELDGPGAEALPRDAPPGRLVVNLDARGQQTIQGFYVPKERIMARVKELRGEQAPVLRAWEQDIVRYAHEHCGGKCGVDYIWPAFQDTLRAHHVQRKDLAALLKSWEDCGWLVRASTRKNDARRVGRELLRLAGLDPDSLPRLDAGLTEPAE